MFITFDVRTQQATKLNSSIRNLNLIRASSMTSCLFIIYIDPWDFSFKKVSNYILNIHVKMCVLLYGIFRSYVGNMQAIIIWGILKRYP